MAFVYALLIILGFVPLAIFLVRQRRASRMAKTGTKALAKIVQIESYHLKSGNNVLIEYVDHPSRTIFQKKIVVAGNPYKVGQELPVIYDPKNPGDMTLDSRDSFGCMLAIGIVIAVGMIVICFFLQDSVSKGL